MAEQTPEAGSPQRGRVLHNVLWLLFEKGLRVLVGLFVVAWVARYLGTARFGLLNYAIAFWAVAGMAVNFGFDAVLLREMVAKPKLTGRLLGTTLGMRAVLVVLVYGLSYGVVAGLNGPSSPEAVLVLVVNLALVSFMLDTFDMAFQAEVRSRFTVAARGLGLLAGAGFKVWAIVMEQSLLLFAWAVVAEWVLGGLLLAAFYFRRHGGAVRLRFDRVWARALLKESWPLMLSAVMIMLYMRVDQMMLNSYGDEEVGIYSAALRLSEVWYVLPLAISGSLAPKLVENQLKEPVLYGLLQRQLFSVLFWSALLLATGVTLVAGWVIPLLFGEAYEASVPVLQLHVWAALPIFLGTAIGRLVVIEAKSRMQFFMSFFGLGANVVFNLWLIPIYLATGAALATLVSQVVAAIIVPCFWPLGRQLLSRMLSSLAPSFALQFARERLAKWRGQA